MKSPAARRAMALAAVLLLLVACKDSGSADPPVSGATVPTLAPTTSTTNPYAVPAVIDAAYVNRVLAAFDGVVGDVARIVVSTKAIPQDAIDRLKGVYSTGLAFQLRVNSFQEEIRRGLTNYKNPPGNPRTTVDSLLPSSATCVHARVIRDYTAVSSSVTSSPGTLWVTLMLVPSSTEAQQYNPTPWYLSYDGFEPGGVGPRNPCGT